MKSKNRIFLNKCLKHFNDFGDVSFGKLDIKNEKSTMIDLYIETCDRHKDFRECDDFFLNLDETQKVEWYGIFKESELIMFSGYWIKYLPDEEFIKFLECLVKIISMKNL